MKQTEFSKLVELNDRVSLFGYNDDPKYIHLNKSPQEFEIDKEGTAMDHVIYCSNYIHDNFPDIEFKNYFLSCWIRALHYYSVPLLILKAKYEDYLPEAWGNFKTFNKSKKGSLIHGLYMGYPEPLSAVSHEIYQIMSNPPNSDQHIHLCTTYCYEFSALDKNLIGMDEARTLDFIKLQKNIGILPMKQYPVGAPVRDKSRRRALEINKIFRYNKYDITTRAMEVLEGDKTSADYDSLRKDELNKMNYSSNE